MTVIHHNRICRERKPAASAWFRSAMTCVHTRQLISAISMTGNAQHRRTQKGSSSGRVNTVATHTAQITHLDAMDWPARSSSEARAVPSCTVWVVCSGKKPQAVWLRIMWQRTSQKRGNDEDWSIPGVVTPCRAMVA